MLKLPKVGKKLNDFMYVTRIVGEVLELAIIFKKDNTHGKSIHKMQNYELKADDRHHSLNIMESNIKACLDGALLGNNCDIRLYEERSYVYFNDDQYTGELVL